MFVATRDRLCRRSAGEGTRCPGRSRGEFGGDNRWLSVLKSPEGRRTLPPGAGPDGSSPHVNAGFALFTLMGTFLHSPPPRWTSAPIRLGQVVVKASEIAGPGEFLKETARNPFQYGNPSPVGAARGGGSEIHG